MSGFAQDAQLQLDRVGQRLLAHRLNDAAGAEDRSPPFDAQSGVKGPFGHRLPLRDAHRGAQADALPRGIVLTDQLDLLADHLPRHPVDGGLADRHFQPRLGHPAHALTAQDGDARLLCRFQAHKDLDAVGGIRVVAAVLADTGLRPSVPCLHRVDRDMELQSLRDGQANRLRWLPTK